MDSRLQGVPSLAYGILSIVAVSSFLVVGRLLLKMSLFPVLANVVALMLQIDSATFILALVATFQPLN